ncbi:hypothetical protein EW146_g2762 [Bondarzewia mesenterica]|uniref:Sortilin N-terminal domain-containing protein n=1 Tax=Bondarzewia mesenterica TaxID=1095465 RepID=A0A4S4M5U9_9AGAM|nr:hypothetical protein EW146_g2762 [Bondarzewia mesenterica]
MSTDPRRYSSTDGGKTWTRELYGLEANLCSMAILNDGFGFFSTTLKVSFPKSLTAADLDEPPPPPSWLSKARP